MRQQLMTSTRNDWETPSQLYYNLDEVFHFEIDLASSEDNHKSAIYITEEMNALTSNWKSVIDNACSSYHHPTYTGFLNPPYSTSLLPFFREIKTQRASGFNTIVTLTPARVETKWFRIAWEEAKYILFIYGRLHFELNKIPQGPATFPSAVSIFTDKEYNITILEKYGKIIKLK